MKKNIINIKNISALLFLVAFSIGCEDIIEVELEGGDNQIVIDAWVTNQSQPQEIRLRRASPYFDSSPSPAESGATVRITESNGTEYIFTEDGNTGNYIWTPDSGAQFGTIGNGFQLDINLANGKNYQAQSLLNRSTPVDSIASVFEEEALGQPEGFYCEFFARDPAGPGDTYWIKTFKNGQFLNKPNEMNLAVDAGFTPGAMVDGVTFITPIRTNVNRIADSGDNAIDTDSLPPYIAGDSIRVEIHSINFETFDFLNQARTQLTLGDAGLFAAPPSNVPTNITALNGTEPKDVPVGFFNVSAVESRERIVE